MIYSGIIFERQNFRNLKYFSKIDFLAWHSLTMRNRYSFGSLKYFTIKFDSLVCLCADL